MRDIVLLVGLSSSGKDYLLKELVNRGFNPFISSTTRPMRDGEQNGIEYNFINTNEFVNLIAKGEVLEHTSYKTKLGLWRYGLLKESVPEVGKFNNVVSVNVHGVKQLLESDIRDRLIVVDIHAPNHMRLQHICERYNGIENMTDKQMCEAFRREVEDAESFHEYFNANSKDIDWVELFKGIPFTTWHHEYNGGVERIYLDIINMIGESSGEA